MPRREIMALMMGAFLALAQGLMANGGSGDGALSMTLWEACVYAPSWAPGYALKMLGIGDIDGDDLPDLLFSLRDRVVTLHGDGHGGFQRESWVLYEMTSRDDPGGTVWVPEGTFDACAGLLADLDDDSDLDLLVSGLFWSPIEGDAAYLYIFENVCGALTPGPRIQSAEPLQELWVDASSNRSDPMVIGRVGERVQGAVRSSLMVYRFKNGMLDEGLQLSIPDGGWPHAIADISRDGVPDLIVSHGDQVRSHAVGPNWEIGPAICIELQEGEVYDIVLRDVNGTGKPELVVASAEGVVILDADSEGLSVRHRWRTQSPVTSVAIGSMEAGASMAIAAWLSAQDEVLVLSWGPESIAGGLMRYAVPVGLTDLRMGDLDGDGRSDLVLAEPLSTRIWMNGGIPYGTTTLAASGQLILALGDVDSDGDTDVLTGFHEGIQLLRNAGDDGFQFSSCRLTGSGTPLAAAISDEDLMVLLASDGGANCSGTGSVSCRGPTDALDGITIRGIPSPHGAAPVVRSVDLDGDRRSETVGLLPSGIWICTESGEVLLHSLPGEASLLTAADLDGDGDQEICVIATDQWSEMVAVDPMEAVEPEMALLFRTDRLPMASTAYDLDGDGKDEVLVVTVRVETDDAQEQPQLHFADWTLDVVGLSEQPHHVPVPESAGRLPWPQDGLAVGDLDGDGLLDVAIGTLYGAGFVVIFDPLGEDLTYKWCSTPLGPLGIADLDGQGCDELVGLVQGTRAVLWVRWNGGGR